MFDSWNPQKFSPSILLSSSHIQTIGSHYMPSGDDITPDTEHLVPLEDGDQILLMDNAAAENTHEKDRIILLIHGLGGCYLSRYMIRLNKRFVEQGYRCLRMNLRACGPSWRYATLPPNAGRSDDLRQTLQFIKEKYPSHPITVIGFSMGANILLKMAGEDGFARSGNIDSLIAVSPPTDLKRGVTQLKSTGGKLYSHFFTRMLKKDIYRLQKNVPELRQYNIDHCRELFEIDECFTAPASGFSSADHYYEESSSLHYLENIKIPGLILGAYDDPIIDGSVYRDLKSHPHLKYHFTEKGGHVAFLGAPTLPLSRAFSSFRWMDDEILRAVEGLV